MTLSSPSRRRLEAWKTVAALRYVEVTGTQAFVIPIPNTTPQLFVAAGKRESIVKLLTSGPLVGKSALLSIASLAKDDTVPRYTVVSFNNAHAGGGGAPLSRCEFDSGEEALTHAKQLVDQALEQLGAVSSAHELMMQYARRGSEVPMIYGEPRIAFHAYQCAREKANAMFAAPT